MEDIEQDKPKKKQGFCTTNKCSFLIFLAVVAAIAVVAVVTFLSPNVRAKVSEKKSSNDELLWWQKTIIYQIYPRSFQDSDGDSGGEGAGVGDLQGIISRLYYFNEIGVDAIWLSPFYKSAMRDFGYDIIDYKAVDPLFGNMSDFDELIEKAHDQGLKVIVDFVPNHTSNDSVWFNQSRHGVEKYKDYYIWSDGVNGGPPNNWQSVFEGSAWQLDPIRRQYFYHAFLDSQPDLNFRNKAVVEEINNVLRFWCEKGVDGFRIDAVPHLFEKANLSLQEPTNLPTNGFSPELHKYTKNQPEIFNVVKGWRDVLDEFKAKDGKERFLIAETAGIPQSARIKYYEAGSVPFFFDLIPAKKTCGATAQCFLDIIRDGLNLTDGQWPNFVIGNHDNSRIASSMGPAYVDVMNMMLLTLPGTPTTYYGEELGMINGDYAGQEPKDPYAKTSNNSANSRDPERNPMLWNTSSNAGFTSSSHPWLSVNTAFAASTVESELKSNTSHLMIYKSLAKIRQRSAFQSLNIDLPESALDVLVYKRYDADETYAVLLNFGNAERKLDISSKDDGPTKGEIVLSTQPRSTKNVNLANTVVSKGEGLIILLLPA